MKKVLILAVLFVAYWLIVKLATKFCGFNQLGHDDDANATGAQPEVARESKG